MEKVAVVKSNESYSQRSKKKVCIKGICMHKKNCSSLTEQSFAWQNSPDAAVGTHKCSPFTAASLQSGVDLGSLCPGAVAPSSLSLKKINEHWSFDIHSHTYIHTCIQEPHTI